MMLAITIPVPIVAHAAVTPPTRDARQILVDAINHFRGLSSWSRMTMTIHRPDWERTMSMEGWSQGSNKALIRVTAPARDAGNATLIHDKNKVWSFAPKINRVIRIPSSMMSQSWMGSDFSNKDISRSEDFVDDYTHTLLRTDEHDGHVVYVIESVPLEEAAVVWGKEVMHIRDDNLLLEHHFIDQALQPVKVMRALEVGEMGGRPMVLRERMENVEEPEKWTEFRLDEVQFDVDVPDYVFTLSNLRNPRR